jgi:tRNA A37 threonylcarbamoyltransferase TsaD
MCTYSTELVEIQGSAKGPAGWFHVSQAMVYYDHPQHASALHTLNLDFMNPEDGPGARVAVELGYEAAKSLALAIEKALERVPTEIREG